MLEWETVHLAVHLELERVQFRAWLIAAALCLACSVATGWAVNAQQVGLAFLLSCLTGCIFYFMSDIARLAKRLFLRRLPPAELSTGLEAKLAAALEPIGQWRYPFAVHVSDPGQCFLLDYDGRWRPQLYISRWMLERWEPEYLRSLIESIRQRLRAERSWFGFNGVQDMGNIAVGLCIYPILAQNSGGHWLEWGLAAVVALLLAGRWHVTWWMRNDERAPTALADRRTSRLLAAEPMALTAFTQAVAMYEYHRHPLAHRRNRTLQRLSFVCHDLANAREWLADYEKFLEASPVPGPLPARAS